MKLLTDIYIYIYIQIQRKIKDWRSIYLGLSILLGNGVRDI